MQKINLRFKIKEGDWNISYTEVYKVIIKNITFMIFNYLTELHNRQNIRFMLQYVCIHVVYVPK